MSNNGKFKINLDNRIVELEKIYISELGFTMIKINNLNGTTTNYNVGKMDPSSNVILDLINESKKTTKQLEHNL
jgi:hypothetical protein